MKTKIVTLSTLALLIAAASGPAVAQDVAWRGQDSEFGSIRAPYSAEMNGERVPVEAKIVLRQNYEEKDGRFYMFAFTVENTPIDVTFDNLVRADTGEEMPCYQRQGDGRSQLKCFVDLKLMPPEGTEIIMRGTAGSSKVGAFQVGMIVVPFTATWTRVQMENGLDAELYGYTQINVQTPTSGGNGGPIAGVGNTIPGLGALGIIAAGAAAIGLLALRRRS